MSAVIMHAPGKFAALTARMLRLELEKAGIITKEAKSSLSKNQEEEIQPAIYIYVDALGNTAFGRYRCDAQTMNSADKGFRYPFLVDEVIGSALDCITANRKNKKMLSESAFQAAEKKQSILLFDNNRTVMINGRDITLTEREYRLFCYLYNRKGSAISRQELAEHVWEDKADIGSNVIEVYISYLRQKIESATGKRLILTIRGKGYEFRDDSVVDSR